MRYLLGVDAGTTSFKASLFNEDGALVSSASGEYSLIVGDGLIEFEAEAYWGVFKDVVRRTLQSAGGVDKRDVKALAIDCQGETMIVTDAAGRPLRNAIVWLDSRAVSEAESIREAFGRQKVYEITGQNEITGGWPASKILWLKNNEKDVFRSAGKFMLLEDYLIFRLTGLFATEKSVQSSSLMLDIRKGVWWGEMLEFIGITPNELPVLHEPGDYIGGVSAIAAQETGLSANTAVVAGALDQLAGVIGAGVVRPGLVSETTGTAMVLCTQVESMPPYKAENLAPCHYHALKGKYCVLLWSPAAGLVLKWFKNSFYDGGVSYQKLDEEAAGIPAGSDGLLMLPHLCGANLPVYNASAKGVFYGITLAHTRAHFVRSVMESVAFMMRRNLEYLDGMGVHTSELRLMGGGAGSRVWNGINADVTGKNVLIPKNTETACLGAAILAGTGVGIFSSVEAACEKTIEIAQALRPDEENLKAYQRYYEAYCRLDGSLDPIFSEISL
ncbi:MAG: FGGY family carbohydrate kinase [Clostridia bacterium]|nr:FGGY family carbohydrate kinase [Clostridia bacterium]MDR3644576.1 FGGY family carbohydrate kinase [Clostridia bacterium]